MRRSMLAASLVCAAAALVLALRLPTPTEDTLPPSDDLCASSDPAARGALVGLRRAAVARYRAAVTGIPAARADALAATLGRVERDPCRLGPALTITYDLAALERDPVLPVYGSALNGHALRERMRMASALGAVGHALDPADATLLVSLAVVVTREPTRHFGSVEALGAQATVVLRDAIEGVELARVEHVLALPDDADPPAPAPWPADAIGMAPDWRDGSQPYTWMVEELTERAMAAALADVGASPDP